MIESLISLEPPLFIDPPPKTIFAKKGSSTNPLPNCSMRTNVSIWLPPNPPSSSLNANPSQPNSAIDDQYSLLKPGSSELIFILFERSYFSCTKRSTLC